MRVYAVEGGTGAIEQRCRPDLATAWRRLRRRHRGHRFRSVRSHRGMGGRGRPDFVQPSSRRTLASRGDRDAGESRDGPRACDRRRHDRGVATDRGVFRSSNVRKSGGIRRGEGLPAHLIASVLVSRFAPSGHALRGIRADGPTKNCGSGFRSPASLPQPRRPPTGSTILVLSRSACLRSDRRRAGPGAHAERRARQAPTDQDGPRNDRCTASRPAGAVYRAPGSCSSVVLGLAAAGRALCPAGQSRRNPSLSRNSRLPSRADTPVAIAAARDGTIWFTSTRPRPLGGSGTDSSRKCRRASRASSPSAWPSTRRAAPGTPKRRRRPSPARRPTARSTRSRWRRRSRSSGG